MKGLVLTPSMTKVCQNSKYLLGLRKCGFETFGKANGRSTRFLGEVGDDKKRLIDLYCKLAIFDTTETRKITKDFFWSEMSRPLNVGSIRDKDKEGLAMSAADKAFESFECMSESERTADDDCEVSDIGEDMFDDENSIASSFDGSVKSEVDGDENSDGEDESTQVEKESVVSQQTKESPTVGLKHLGNVVKKEMDV